jgi:hypothetical protein
MNHPLPSPHEPEPVTAIARGVAPTAPANTLDDGAGKTMQWLYEQWLAKDVAAPAPRRE